MSTLVDVLYGPSTSLRMIILRKETLRTLRLKIAQQVSDFMTEESCRYLYYKIEQNEYTGKHKL